MGTFTAPWTMHAARQMQRTMALIALGMARGLELDARQAGKYYTRYPPEAQVDALLTLGYLRPVTYQWIFWDRIRRASLKGPVEKDESPEVQACIRAMGQVDIPAIRYLTGRIPSEWAPQQQRAAAFVLGKLAGRYSKYFLQEEMATYEKMVAEPHDRDERDEGKTGLKRLKDMLKVGTDEKWFEGEFWGTGDPHAYDLVLPPLKDETGGGK